MNWSKNKYHFKKEMLHESTLGMAFWCGGK